MHVHQGTNSLFFGILPNAFTDAVPIGFPELSAYSLATSPNKTDSTNERREKDYIAYLATPQGMQNPMTYQQYIAQFEGKAKSDKVAAGRAAMKP